MRYPFGSAVVGVSFHQEAVRLCTPGQVLWLRHDPENPYDSNACLLTTRDGTPLGHLPAPVAAKLIGTGDRGPWPVKIEDVLRGETWGLRIVVHAPMEPTTEVPETAPEPAGDTDTPVHADSPTEAAVTVRVRGTGRVVGTLVERRLADNKVVVDAGGAQIAYPADLVEIAA